MAASKLKQILRLEPANEIAFQGPFEQVVTSYLELKNPSEKRICFKVKTTAPKRYCVRPNSGIVEPDGKVKIAIMLQPLDPDSEAEARTKHKFMVQSTIIKSDDEYITLEEVWQNTKPELIMDSKLRCVFHSPDQQEGDGDGALVSGFKQRKADSGVSTESSGGNVVSNAASTTDTTSTANQQTVQQIRKPTSYDDMQQSEVIRTSTPVSPQVTSSKWGASSSTTNQNLKFGQSAADKSVASSQNLTSSFIQPMSDDHKIVLVSLVMLVLGVILGKYVI